MSARRFLIAANWKMYAPPVGSYADDSPYRTRKTVDVWVFPPFIDWVGANKTGLVYGAQCGHPESEGAHTGDISMAMLGGQRFHAVLCGHSERRHDHGETDAFVGAQALAGLKAGVHPVICCGETLEEREAGKAQDAVKHQLSGLPLDQDITLAYEPVWAIGTGKTATPEMAQEMHAFIRSLLPAVNREKTRILYGGSMKPDNAQELLKQKDIDGGLIGSASLKPDQFGEIVRIAEALTSRN